MFAAACTIATAFTRPVIISVLRFDGSCRSGVGSFVVLNDEGWIVTAAHIVNDLETYAKSRLDHDAYLAEIQRINDDQGLLADQKRKKTRQLTNQRPLASIVKFSPWWGFDGSVGDGSPQTSPWTTPVEPIPPTASLMLCRVRRVLVA